MLSNFGIGGNEVKLDASEAISEIPQNRTLMVQKLTTDAPIKPKMVEGLQTIEQVFAHYKPTIKIDFENSEGGTQTETLAFQNLGDFGTKGITAQSQFLTDLEVEKEQYQKIIKQLKTNKILRGALENPEAKEALLNIIDDLISELNQE